LKEFQSLETINKHLKEQVTQSIKDHISIRSTIAHTAISDLPSVLIGIEVSKTRYKRA